MSASIPTPPVTSADACHTVELFNGRIKVLESQYAAELWAEDYGETRGYLGDEPGVVEEIRFEGETIGVIRVATEREVAELFDGDDYFDAVGA